MVLSVVVAHNRDQAHQNHTVLDSPFDSKQAQHTPIQRKAITMSYSALASASWSETTNVTAEHGEVESTEAAGLIYECDVGAKDIILGKRYSSRLMVPTVEKWWLPYFSAGQLEKRGILQQVVDDLRAQDFRFLRKVEKGGKVVCYAEAKKDCEKVRKRVLGHCIKNKPKDVPLSLPQDVPQM
jgi:hypothetical protein